MAKVRVYELAKEFGVESKAVMARLQEMGEFVRSASSTIEAPVVRRLKEEFSAQAPKTAQARKPRPAAEPSGAAPGAAGSDAAADGQNGGRKVARPAPGRPQAPVPGGPGAGAGRPVASPQATGPAPATATDQPAAATWYQHLVKADA